jgi:hypothetical protein
VDLIYSSQQDGPARLDLIKTFLTDWGVDKANIVQWAGSGGSGDGEARGSPSGKAVVQVCVNLQLHFTELLLTRDCDSGSKLMVPPKVH